MFFTTDEDEQDFISPGGSKLASLFGVDKATGQGGNESLTYTAPKQPKKKKEAPSSSSSGSPPSVIYATVAHAYKYTDGQYVSQGKLGAALLGNQTTKDYRILLYVSKQQQVTNAKITSGFSFTVQANLYVSFHDEARQTWSLKFDSEDAAVQLAKNVAVAKANMTGASLDTVITQDLVIGEGGSLESGDSAEVKYTGCLYTNSTFGKVFDSNVNTDKTFKLKLGKGKVIKGWDTGMIGMKKNGKRLLIIPPNLAYGSQGMGDRVPPNSTLIFEIEILRVKLAKGDSRSTSPVVGSTPLPVPDSDTLGVEDSVKGRTKSISDQLSQSPKTDKAKLISRMAKMGQPMLPLQGAVPAHVEDDSDGQISDHHSPSPEIQPAKITPAPKPLIQPHALHQPVQPAAPQPVIAQQVQTQPSFVQNLPAAQQVAVFQPQVMPHPSMQPVQPSVFPMVQPQGQNTMYNSAFHPPQQFPNVHVTPPTPTTPNANMPLSSTATDAQLPVLMSESRQQNTEVRLAVSKVSDKLDKVLEKVDHLQTQNTSTMQLHNMMPSMETSVLLHNIQRIITDNERLKTDLFEKSGKIETLNVKISDLLRKNQSAVEQSQSLMEQRNEGITTSSSQMQAKVLTLEKEKVNLATSLNETTAQISILQLEITELRKKEVELNRSLQSTQGGNQQQQQEIERLSLQCKDDEKRIEEQARLIKDERQQRRDVENSVSHLQDELGDLKASKESLEKNLTDRRKKAAEDRIKMEEEIEELKTNYEVEIKNLRDKLRKQKTSTDSAKAEQLTEIEAELNREWQQKTDRLIKATQDKHDRAVQDLMEEKDSLIQKNKELDSKLLTVKSSSGSSEREISNLKDEVEELKTWKEKYDILRNQASSMKDKYESMVKDLQEERDDLQEEKTGILEKAKELQQKLNKQQQTQPTDEKSSSPDLLMQVKKIMNSVYQELKSEFDSDLSYKGGVILAAILQTIKNTTLKLVNEDKTGLEETEEVEDEEEEEDEEESDEEVEEEKEDKTEVDELKTEQRQPSVEIDRTEQETVHTIETTEIQQSTPNEFVEIIESESKESVIEKNEIESSESIVSDQIGDNEQSDDRMSIKSDESGDSFQSIDDNVEISHPVVSNSNENEDHLEQIKTEGDHDVSDDYASPLRKSADDTSDHNDIVINASPQTDTDVNDVSDHSNTNTPSPKKEVPVPVFTSREPPPLMDDEDKSSADSPLFGNDGTVEDTFGPEFTTKQEEERSKKKLPTKDDLSKDEHNKEKRPPPLFDDDDDSDLDWLS